MTKPKKATLPPNFQDTVEDAATLAKDLITRTAQVLGDFGKRWMDGMSHATSTRHQERRQAGQRILAEGLRHRRRQRHSAADRNRDHLMDDPKDIANAFAADAVIAS